MSIVQLSVSKTIRNFTIQCITIAFNDQPAYYESLHYKHRSCESKTNVQLCRAASHFNTTNIYVCRYHSTGHALMFIKQNKQCIGALNDLRRAVNTDKSFN